MFNVTVIKLKDIVKLIIILCVIYIFVQVFLKNVSLKNYLDQKISINTSDFLRLGINTESNIIKNIANKNTQEIKEQTEEIEEDFKEISIKSILQIGSNVFKAKKLEKKVEQNENPEQVNNQTTENEENIMETAQINDVKTDVSTEIVTKNPIKETYNREYNGVKIKNGTSYELTDNVLNTDNLNIDKNNVIIFHTHTCESYTPSENYQYTSSR